MAARIVSIPWQQLKEIIENLPETLEEATRSMHDIAFGSRPDTDYNVALNQELFGRYVRLTLEVSHPLTGSERFMREWTRGLAPEDIPPYKTFATHRIAQLDVRIRLYNETLTETMTDRLRDKLQDRLKDAEAEKLYWRQVLRRL